MQSAVTENTLDVFSLCVVQDHSGEVGPVQIISYLECANKLLLHLWIKEIIRWLNFFFPEAEDGDDYVDVLAEWLVKLSLHMISYFGIFSG